MKKILPNLLTTIFSLLFLFFVLEALVRLCVNESKYSFTPAIEDWTSEADVGWKNKPNYKDKSVRYGKLVTYQTNEDGFRPFNAHRQKAPNTLRVMLVGNSTVAARDVPEEHTIHAYLDSLLDLSGYQFEVINAGVLGYSTDQALLSIKKNINLYEPDIVCYGYCVNDLFANTNTEYSGLYKPAYQWEEEELVLQPPPRQNRNIDKMLRSNSIRDLIQHSALYRVLQPYVLKARLAFSKQAVLDQGGINRLDIYEQPTSQEPTLALLRQLLLQMDKTCYNNCARFYFYAHPEVVTVWPPYRQAIGKVDISPYLIEQKLQEIADENSLSFIPMVSHFLQRLDMGPFHLLPTDPHCNAQGYLLQAEVLAAEILGDIHSGRPQHTPLPDSIHN